MTASTDRPDGETYDVLGVGFGPANLALAIALEECNSQRWTDGPLRIGFLERQASFGWHRGMLIDTATMQVSFLKDLVTQRNPSSDFSFVSYLHASGRLSDFINLKTLYPLRLEFHDYLEWAARRLQHRVEYDSDVVEIWPVDDEDKRVVAFDVHSRSSCGTVRVRRARNLVLAGGLVPNLPDGVVVDDRVWHSVELLGRAGRLDPGSVRRVVVVGAGQSAAEVTGHLHERFPTAEICSVFRRFGYSPSDDSPFANRIFDPESVDTYFQAPEDVKRLLLGYHRNTNYSVVDLEDINDLYRRAYVEQLTGRPRLRMFPVSEVVSVDSGPDGVTVGIFDRVNGERTDVVADALVYATGYRPRPLESMLGSAASLCVRDASGAVLVERDHRLRTVQIDSGAAVYVQGNAELSHGLGSTLLSNVAPRAGEIVDSLVARRTRGDHRALVSIARS